jgi:hypothetical protein
VYVKKYAEESVLNIFMFSNHEISVYGASKSPGTSVFSGFKTELSGMYV